MSANRVYKVWNESVQFDIDRIEYPASVQELKDIVEKALNQGYTLKAVGIGHSNTEIVAPKGDNAVYVSLTNLNGVKSCSGNEITVEGGLTLHELCAYLKGRHQEPYSILEYGFFHIGAICGTHAHDTNSKNDSALFASHMTGLKILSYNKSPDGRFKVVSQEFHESTHPQEMRFLRSHFGLLGIVYEVTLRIKPAKMFAIQYTIETIDRFLEHAESAFYEGEEEQRFITFAPNTRDVFIERRRRLDHEAKSQKKSLKGLIFFWGRLKAFFHVEKIASKIKLRFLQKLIEYVARKTYAFLLPMATKNPIILHPCDRAVVYNTLPTFDYVEWAYPINQIKSVLTDLLRLQRKHGLCNIFNLYLEREDDDAILSRTFNGDKISIDIVHPGMDQAWYRFVAEWHEISMQHDGIPHFNKTPRLTELLDRNGMSRFYPIERIRDYARFRKSMDPEDVFNNRFGESFSSASNGE